MRRAIFRALSLLPIGLSAGAMVATLSLSPFTAPLVDRSTEEAGRAIERALARQVTPDWLAHEMDAALQAGDWDRVQTLALIGADRGFAPSPDHAERMAALEAQETGFWAQAGDCLTCMADVAECPSVGALAACGIPFELTPLGDLNVLRREGLAALTGAEVDRLDVALAFVGLGATAIIVVSGGTSYTVKGGATAIRVGRRLGTLTAPFLRVLGEMSDFGLRTDRLLPWLRGQARTDEVVDLVRLGRIDALASDLTRVYDNTGSMAETVRLLAHVDSAGDANRLARASDVLGPKTSRTFEVLGKERVFRALVRLSDLTLTAITLTVLLALQLAAALGHLIAHRLILRPLSRWGGRQAKL